MNQQVAHEKKFTKKSLCKVITKPGCYTNTLILHIHLTHLYSRALGLLSLQLNKVYLEKTTQYVLKNKTFTHGTLKLLMNILK